MLELFTAYTSGMADAFARYKGKDGRFPQLLGARLEEQVIITLLDSLILSVLVFQGDRINDYSRMRTFLEPASSPRPALALSL